MPHRIAIAIAIAIAAAFGTLLAAATLAQADPVLDYTLGTSLKHSDNINYSSTDPVSDNILSPRLDFLINQKGSAFDANAAGSLQYRDYLGGKFDNEFRTLFAGTGIWHISPERLDWFFQDSAGREPINVLQSDSPTNNQQTNVFTTGPTLHTRFTDTLRGQFDLRYSNTYADTSNLFNSNRWSGLGTVLYELDPTDSFSGNVAGSQVRYTNTISQPFDYDRQDAYIAYQRTSRLFTLDAAVGYSHLDIDNSGGQSGSLLRASGRWTPDLQTSVTFSASRQYADASQDLVFSPSQIAYTGIGSGINGSVLTPQVYLEKRIGVEAKHRNDTWQFGIAPYYRKLDYVIAAGPDLGLNQNARGVLANAAYYFTPELWLGGDVGTERRNYTQIARTDDDLAYGLSLNYQRTRHWLFSVRAEHQRRDSDLPQDGYHETSVMLTAAYHR